MANSGASQQQLVYGWPKSMRKRHPASEVEIEECMAVVMEAWQLSHPADSVPLPVRPEVSINNRTRNVLSDNQAALLNPEAWSVDYWRTLRRVSKVCTIYEAHEQFIEEVQARQNGERQYSRFSNVRELMISDLERVYDIICDVQQAQHDESKQHKAPLPDQGGEPTSPPRSIGDARRNPDYFEIFKEIDRSNFKELSPTHPILFSLPKATNVTKIKLQSVLNALPSSVQQNSFGKLKANVEVHDHTNEEGEEVAAVVTTEAEHHINLGELSNVHEGHIVAAQDLERLSHQLSTAIRSRKFSGYVCHVIFAGAEKNIYIRNELLDHFGRLYVNGDVLTTFKNAHKAELKLESQPLEKLRHQNAIYQDSCREYLIQKERRRRNGRKGFKEIPDSGIKYLHEDDIEGVKNMMRRDCFRVNAVKVYNRNQKRNREVEIFGCERRLERGKILTRGLLQEQLAE